jgi:hypothetical protein
VSELTLAWSLAAVLALLLLLLLIGRALSRWRRGFVARERGQTASQGERDAEELLSGLGFRVIDRQVSLHWSIECDGQPHPVDLRADMLVERGGQRYVAEVKTGLSAPSLRLAATRRQLLEYAIAYQVESVLLVDMAARTVREVRFPS